MKKALKIIGITLASLIAIVIIVVCIAIWLVFTPERLTPIAQKQSAKLLTCESHIGKVELTFFSTFPNFGLQLNDVYAVNPTDGASTDTVASLKSLTASIDLMAYLKNKQIVLHYFQLEDGQVNLYTDAQGKSNFDIIASTDTTTQEESSEPLFTTIDLTKVSLKQVRGSYVDQQSGIESSIGNFDGDIQLSQEKEETQGALQAHLSNLQVTLQDSVPLYASTPDLKVKLNASLTSEQGEGALKLSADKLYFAMGKEVYVDHQPIELDAPLQYAVKEKQITLEKTKLTYGDLKLNMQGWVTMLDNSYNTDLTIQSDSWDIPYLISLVPQSFTSYLDGLTIKGEAELEAHIQGVYDEQHMPDIDAIITLSDGLFKSKDLPITVKNIDTRIAANLLLDSGQISQATIEHFDATIDHSKISAKGHVSDLMGLQACNVTLNGDLNLPDFAPFLPDSMGLTLQGRAKGQLKGSFNLADLTDLNLKRIKAEGSFQIDQFAASTDSMNLQSPAINLTFKLPSQKKLKKFNDLIELDLQGKTLLAKMIDLGEGRLDNYNIKAIINDPLNDKVPLAAQANIDAATISASMDTMDINIDNLKAEVDYLPSKSNADITNISLNYLSSHLKASMGRYAQVKTEHLDLFAKLSYNSKESSSILNWNPELKVNLKKGELNAQEISKPIYIPNVNFDFTPGICDINSGQFIIGSSDFNLKGRLSNLDKYVNQTGLLTGSLDFTSHNTDVNELMALVNGMGRTDSVVPMESPEDDPFMVPKGVDISLNTSIEHAYAGNGLFDDVDGKLTVKDGILILEQMGFTSKAAEMQLTAMYRSDRKNHLFAGVDFHLLDIDVKELIHLIPDIDTIVPMLKSFDGKAEFHLAAETYLKSNYDLKMSTLRGAAAIEGKDLVVLDGETFSTIAKYMMFNKKTRNKIDTMSVEMTVFRNAVDVYPFLIVMDRYRAIISGRHNLDMTFDYNLSAIAPIRLGLEVKGNFDNMKYKLTKAQNATLFEEPKKRKVVEEQTMALKKMINESLKSNVKERAE